MFDINIVCHVGRVENDTNWNIKGYMPTFVEKKVTRDCVTGRV